MKTILFSALRTAAVATMLLVLSASAWAKNPSSTDPVSQLLAQRGSIPVQAVGPYVEIGTPRIQVSVKLGSPSARVADDLWLYENFRAEGSSSSGTLVVRFEQGRVSALSLATRAVAAALLSPTTRGGEATAVVASNARR
jgi:hypothetical protein